VLKDYFRQEATGVPEKGGGKRKKKERGKPGLAISLNAGRNALAQHPDRKRKMVKGTSSSPQRCISPPLAKKEGKKKERRKSERCFQEGIL